MSPSHVYLRPSQLRGTAEIPSEIDATERETGLWNITATEAVSEDLPQQELTSQFPATVTTAHAQQQNVTVYTTPSWHTSDVQQTQLARSEMME